MVVDLCSSYVFSEKNMVKWLPDYSLWPYDRYHPFTPRNPIKPRHRQMSFGHFCPLENVLPLPSVIILKFLEQIPSTSWIFLSIQWIYEHEHSTRREFFFLSFFSLTRTIFTGTSYNRLRTNVCTVLMSTIKCHSFPPPLSKRPHPKSFRPCFGWTRCEDLWSQPSQHWLSSENHHLEHRSVGCDRTYLFVEFSISP